MHRKIPTDRNTYTVEGTGRPLRSYNKTCLHLQRLELGQLLSPFSQTIQAFTAPSMPCTSHYYFCLPKLLCSLVNSKHRSWSAVAKYTCTCLHTTRSFASNFFSSKLPCSLINYTHRWWYAMLEYTWITSLSTCAYFCFSVKTSGDNGHGVCEFELTRARVNSKF